MNFARCCLCNKVEDSSLSQGDRRWTLTVRNPKYVETKLLEELYNVER